MSNNLSMVAVPAWLVRAAADALGSKQDEIDELEHQWQPIETAPKDGTVVIVRGFEKRPTPMLAAAAQYRSGIWFRDNNGYGFVVQCDPTHWMPLPKPPNHNP